MGEPALVYCPLHASINRIYADDPSIVTIPSFTLRVRE
jgi:hypothetical protein